jgi:hypothetical protein
MSRRRHPLCGDAVSGTAIEHRLCVRKIFARSYAEIEAQTEEGGDSRGGGSAGKTTPKADRKPPKVISPSDPSSAWTAKANKRVQFGYGLNYLIDVEHAIIVDVEATPARTFDEVGPWRNAAAKRADAAGIPPLKNPITGIAGCCARAASGQATAVPPGSVMNPRRPFDHLVGLCRGDLVERRQAAARAQQRSMPVIGYLGTGSPGPLHRPGARSAATPAPARPSPSLPASVRHEPSAAG